MTELRSRFVRAVSCALTLLFISANICRAVPANAAADHPRLSSVDWHHAILTFSCKNVVDSVKADAVTGDQQAIEEYAIMLYRGCGVAENWRLANQYFKSAIAKGSSDKLSMGFVDLFSDGGSPTRGIDSLTQAYQSGNVFAAGLLARYYDAEATFTSDAEAKKVDLASAREWVQKSERGGDYVGITRLAYLELMDPATRDDGRSLLAKAVAAKVPEAIWYLGWLYTEGYAGYSKSLDRGQQLRDEAISDGCAICEFNEAGLRVTDRSSQPGGVVSADVVAEMLDATKRLLPEKVMDGYLGEALMDSGNKAAYPQAFNLLFRAKDTPVAGFDCDLAYMYWNGFGTSVNMQLVMQYEHLAAQKGSAYAVSYLKAQQDSQVISDPRSDYEKEAQNYEGYHWNDLHPMNPNH